MTTSDTARRSRIWPIAVILLAVLVAGLWYYSRSGKAPEFLASIFPASLGGNQGAGQQQGAGSARPGVLPTTQPGAAHTGPVLVQRPESAPGGALSQAGTMNPADPQGSPLPGGTAPGTVQDSAQPEAYQAGAAPVPDSERAADAGAAGGGTDPTKGTTQEGTVPSPAGSSSLPEHSGSAPLSTGSAGSTANPGAGEGQAFGANGVAKAQPGSGPAGSAPVILYGKAKPLAGKRHQVRGVLPDGQDDAVAHIAPGGQDGLIKRGFVEDFAHFLVENYWPAGTHPTAGNRPVSTARIKWANTRYGAGLEGFSVDHAQPEQARHQVLEYIFIPSMIKGLYGLYDGRFFDAMENEALARRVGPKKEPLTAGQTADMFAVYGNMSIGLGKTVKMYAKSPALRAAIAEYALVDEQAEEAARRYAAAAPSAKVREAAAYRSAVAKRERVKNNVMQSMQTSGGAMGVASGLDAESLLYVGQWLSRRGEGKIQAAQTLAEVLESAGARLKDLEQYYRSNPQARLRMERQE